MAAPLVIAAKAIGTKVLAKSAAKTAATKVAKEVAISYVTDKAMEVASKKATPALDKLRAMSKQQASNAGEEKPRNSIQATQDLLSETAVCKLLDDLLKKFEKTRGSVNEKMKKEGLTDEILTEQTKNTTLSKGLDQIQKEVSKPKFRNKMR